MAKMQAQVPFTTVALVAATAKSVVGIKAPTNQCAILLELGLGFDGATSTNAAAIVELMGSTFATNGPGTNSTSVTPVKQDSGRQETVQTTAAKAWTTEPTVLTLWRSIDVPQYNGFIVLPLRQWFSELVIAGAAGFVVRITSPNNVNVSGYLTFEE